MESGTTAKGQSEGVIRKNEIAQAAVPLFLRYGYKKTSMDAVAAAVKLSRQAIYLHFPSKEALFSAVVTQLCESTRDIAHQALWRPGLNIHEQLLAAFDETMPAESMELLSELLDTAKFVVPRLVIAIDSLVVQEVSARLLDALDGHQWPVPGVTVQEVAEVLQATSYGLKQQTHNRSHYLIRMKSTITLILTAGGLMPPTNKVRPRHAGATTKGAPK